MKNLFQDFLGIEREEGELFFLISNAIISRFSSLEIGEFYFFRFEKANGGKSKIIEILNFPDYPEYADFLWSHEYNPYYVTLQQQGNRTHLVMPGFYKFMAHEIYGSEIKYPYYHDRNPNAPKVKLPPREMIEKGFAEMTGQLTRTKPPRTV